MSHLALLYVTFPTREEARRVGQHLLEEKLVGCVNILGPIQSLYTWQDKIEESQEVVALLKTTPERVADVRSAIEAAHSYDTPAIIELPVTSTNDAFAGWLTASVR